MLRILIAGALVATCGAGLADPLYKCNVDGIVTYSSEKCKGKVLGEISAPEPRKANPGLAADLQRDKALAAKLEKERLARDLKDDKAAEADKPEAAGILTPAQRRCARLRLDKKMADEKLVGAREADLDALRQDAQRKGELLASECPA